MFIYYQLMIMKRELVSYNVHKAHFNYMKHNAYYNVLVVFSRYDYSWNIIIQYDITLNDIILSTSTHK